MTDEEEFEFRLRREKEKKLEFRYDPAEGMSTIGKLRAGAGKAFADIGLGVRQLLLTASPEEVKESRKRDAPLMSTGAGITGNIAGNVAAAVPLAFAPGANTVLGAGLYGAGYGALQPAESATERLENMAISGGGSAAITGAVRAAPAAYKAIVSPFTKKGRERISLDAISRFSHDPQALAKANIDELISGSRPTLAEATGDPGIAQLHRAMMAKSPETASLLAENKTARMLARKNALLSIAGDQDELMFHEAARASTAKQLYDQAYKKGIDITKNAETGAALSPAEIAGRRGEITKLLQRPAIQDAMRKAKVLARNEGVRIDNPAGSVKGLDYMKRALDDQIEQAGKKGLGNEQRILGDLKDRLLTTIDTLSPDYAAARAVYQDMSKPINRMEVGKYLYDKLVPALSDLGAERITPQAFAKALKDGDAVAKKATGFQGAKLADVLTQDDIELLAKLGKDLGRESRAIDLARVPGSPTAQYLAGGNALRQVMGPLGLPESWAESALAQTLGSRWISAATAPVENKLQEQLGRYLVNPSEAKKAMASLAGRNQRLVPLSNVSRYSTPPFSVGIATYANQE